LPDTALTVHPKIIDTKGLVAVFYEGLLARVCLREKPGFTRIVHSSFALDLSWNPFFQLPSTCNAFWMNRKVLEYKFDAVKVSSIYDVSIIEKTKKQLVCDWQHLLKKLQRLDPKRYEQLVNERPVRHPSVKVIRGVVRDWEKVS
jgi:hypothetical protein